jgi:hypothetical protein
MADFMQKRKEQANIKSLGDLRAEGRVTGKNDPSKYVNGPSKIDCLARPWHRGDLTGILAGPGVGKTTFVLYMFKHILLNNPTGVVAFVSLEMTAGEIAEKWFKATEECPEIADRFYVVENYDEEGKSRDLTSQQIKYELKKIRETLGETLIAFALDHLHEININGAVDYNPVCKDLKNTAVELDTHGFILSQTTKGKGIGDIPVAKDGCYGTSRYEWLMTNILTIFQPLKRVQKECSLPVLAWSYVKIRYKNAKDKVKEDMNYLLRYDFETEDLVELNNNEKTDFALYYEKVLELRQNEEKFKSFQFDLSTTIKGANGKEVKLDKIVGGSRPQSLDDEL